MWPCEALSRTSLALFFPTTHLCLFNLRCITKSTRSPWKKWTAWLANPTVWSSGEALHPAALLSFCILSPADGPPGHLSCEGEKARNLQLHVTS